MSMCVTSRIVKIKDTVCLRKVDFTPAFIVAIIGMTAAQAQTESQAAAANVSGLKEAITQGVMISPRVNADWYNFAAKGYAEQGARGSYYPAWT